jgi:HAD superfamily hydrolase (TIGR01490 family)
MNHNSIKVFFDVDGTIIRGKTQIIAFFYLWKKRQIPFFFPIKILFWSIKYKTLSSSRKEDFIPQIMRRIYSCLKGKKVDEMEELYQDIFREKIKPKIMLPVVQTLKDHQEQGNEVILISASIEPLVKLIGDYLGVDKIIASKLEVTKGEYTGRITKVIYKKEKLKSTKDLGYNLKQSFFYTDSYSDIPLLEEARHPIAVNPDYKLKKRAQKENWLIIYP